MKTCSASQELVDILLKNGFIDKTKETYPDHYKRMKEKGYNPYAVRRKFTNHSRRDFIFFDYVNITPLHNGGCTENECRYTPTTDELKSLITFYKLPVHDRGTWSLSYNAIPELHLRYKEICEHPTWYNSAFDKRVKKVFESVIVN